jgi:hypothetical protein
MSDALSSIAALLAVFVSGLALFFSRWNVKTEKYIATIVAQRIAWIDDLRSDLSDVITFLYAVWFYESDDFTFGRPSTAGFKRSEDAYSINLSENNRKKFSDLAEKSVDKFKLLQKIDISILRLNQSDDSKLISLLMDARDRIITSDYAKRNGEKYIQDLREEITKTLKAEWEKVKHETIAGGEKRRRFRSGFKFLP